MGIYYLQRGAWSSVLIFYNRRPIDKAMILFFENMEVNTTEVTTQVKNGCL